MIPPAQRASLGAAGALTAAQLHDRFLTPVRLRESQVEQEFLTTARCGTLDWHGLPLATYTWGEGSQSVLLLHGWGGRAAQLRAFVAPLIERGYRVVGVDALGHGRSLGSQPSVFQIAATVQLIGQKVGGFAAVIAHSLGAASAAMAIARGFAVRRAVLIAPMCRLADAVTRFAIRLQLSAEQREGVCALLEADFGVDMWDQSSLVRVAPRLTVPALIVHDREDAEIPYQDGVDTAAAWPGAELVTTAGLGHRTILRHPEVVSRVVSFISDPLTTFRIS